MPVRDYVDFDLAIEAEGGEFVARVLDSPAGNASGRFSLPFSSVELENFVLKVGRTRVGIRRVGSPESVSAERFGRQLYEAAFAGEVGTCFRRSLDAAEQAEKGLRLRLRLADAPTLNDVPWEFLWVEGLGRFVVMSIDTPLVRYIELSQGIRPIAVSPPLRILMMVSNPRDVESLDVDKEVGLLREATADLVTSGRVELVVMEDATLPALTKRLGKLNEQFHVFHFLGHGGYVEGRGILMLEDEAERAREVSGRDMGMILHDHKSLRLAILNACEGSRTSAEEPFSGVAQSLVRQGIPAVIAMQFEISDTAAIAFAHDFYLAMTEGHPVDGAVAEARRAIFASGNDVEWATPVLYLRARDGRIFDVTEPPPPPPPPQPPAPQPVPPLPTPAPVLDPEAEFERAAEAAEAKSWREATRRLEIVLQAQPGHAEAAKLLTEARRRLQALVLIDQGRAAHAAGRWEEAVAAFREAAELDPDFSDDDGLRADAEWRLNVLRQPVEPEAPPAAVPEAEVPQAEVPPTEVPQAELPAPPAPTPSRRRRRRVWLAPTLVGIALVLLFLLVVFIAALFEPTPVVTTTATQPTSVTTGPEGVTTTGGALPAADVTALRFTSPPLIDVDPAEWTFLPQAASTNIVAPPGFNGIAPTAQWWIGWDGTALYVFVAVLGDSFVEQRWADQPDQLWKGDSVSFEFGPDPRDLDAAAGLRSEDVHVLMGPIDLPGLFPAITAVNRVGAGALKAGPPEPTIQAVSALTDAPGYWVEAMIPWQVLNVSDPASGAVFGMNLNLSDGDGAGELRVMVSSNPDRTGENQPHPGTWDTVVLGP